MYALLWYVIIGVVNHLYSGCIIINILVLKPMIVLSVLIKKLKDLAQVEQERYYYCS